MIDTIPDLTPAIDHYLLYDGPYDVPGTFLAARHLGVGWRGAARNLATALRDWKPDLVHAHSSHAGVLARVLPHHVPVIYQPHCFAFSDPARPKTIRALLRAAEAVLARRTSTVAAVSPHEAALGRSLAPGRLAVVEVPNWTPLREATVPPDRLARRVAMAGRIAPQKDPDFFRETAIAARGLDDSLDFIWVGDGDQRARRALEEAGVKVTGWLDGPAVAKELAGCSAYCHTARYEGFPVSVLDAARLGLPIAARSIGAFEGLPVAVFQTPKELAAHVVDLHETERRYEEERRSSARILDHMNRSVATQALEALYRSGRG
ncbi:glycosyltransferase [Blastococcus sp. CT_GayMR16]|uniref:glycosyltransferase n=1 Tax=Blastococcus sp. CT_GayMR16 TaxID=2559607 RepID=UPI0014319D73|nr:glycosyltransferase [Blastococcus sp. CT_GayMR16]